MELWHKGRVKLSNESMMLHGISLPPHHDEEVLGSLRSRIQTRRRYLKDQQGSEGREEHPAEPTFIETIGTTDFIVASPVADWTSGSRVLTAAGAHRVETINATFFHATSNIPFSAVHLRSSYLDFAQREEASHPTIGVVRARLMDHMAAWLTLENFGREASASGADGPTTLLELVAAGVLVRLERAMVEEGETGLDVFLLRSWGWADLVVLLRHADPNVVHAAQTAIETMTLRDMEDAPTSDPPPEDDTQGVVGSTPIATLKRQIERGWAGDGACSEDLKSCSLFSQTLHSLGHARAYADIVHAKTAAGPSQPHVEADDKPHDEAESSANTSQVWRFRTRVEVRPGHYYEAQRTAKEVLTSRGVADLQVLHVRRDSGTDLNVEWSFHSAPGIGFANCISALRSQLRELRGVSNLRTSFIRATSTQSNIGLKGAIHDRRTRNPLLPKNCTGSDQVDYWLLKSVGVPPPLIHNFSMLKEALRQANSDPQTYASTLPLTDIFGRLERHALIALSSAPRTTIEAWSMRKEIQAYIPVLQTALRQRAGIRPKFAGQVTTEAQIPNSSSQLLKVPDAMIAALASAICVLCTQFRLFAESGGLNHSHEGRRFVKLWRSADLPW